MTPTPGGRYRSRGCAEPMTRAELLALPATVDVATAARALGISRTLAEQMIAGSRDTPFPARVLRLGDIKRVCTDDLVRAVLGDAAPALADLIRAELAAADGTAPETPGTPPALQ